MKNTFGQPTEARASKDETAGTVPRIEKMAHAPRLLAGQILFTRKRNGARLDLDAFWPSLNEIEML